MAAPFEVFLVTPERELWSGQATIVIARGIEGEVGIQNGHVPLLIQLDIGPLFIQPPEGERIAAAVDGGFLHVVTNDMRTRVDVLAEHAELAGARDRADLTQLKLKAKPKGHAAATWKQAAE